MTPRQINAVADLAVDRYFSREWRDLLGQKFRGRGAQVAKTKIRKRTLRAINKLISTLGKDSSEIILDYAVSRIRHYGELNRMGWQPEWLYWDFGYWVLNQFFESSDHAKWLVSRIVGEWGKTSPVMALAPMPDLRMIFQ